MRPSLPERVLYYGKDEPLPERVSLRAGPLSLIYEAGDLRYIKLGEKEVIRRIYAAVRDPNWGTVAGRLSDVELDVRDDSFRISYNSEHKQGEIHFLWRGDIIGEADGTIRFTFDGEAQTTFLKNRIGLCVLHPANECAGAICRVEYVSGASKTAAFPRLVAADQPVKDIHDLKAIAHEVEPGVWAEARFDGEVFEMEDQRNWIDASYKTFCPPLRIPYPVEIKAGTEVRQSVTLSLRGIENWKLRVENLELKEPPRANPSDILQFSILNSQSPVPLPPIGLGAPSHNALPCERQVKRLQRLKMGHLRLDLRLAEPEWPGEFRLHSSHAMDIGVPLEVALHFPNASRILPGEVIDALAPLRSDLLRFVLFQDGTTGAPERLLRLARKPLVEAFPGVPVGGGTSADFYQLNQFRPPAGLCDFICWSINPQVHAFDNASLAETPSAIPAQVESAKEYIRGVPIVISPITLKPRSNPVATGMEAWPSPGELPPQVDPRQMSLFGACWTLAAFKYLAESGVDSVTFYETTGWRGVMETEAGSPLPDKFPSLPGAVFPLYHVLADIGEFRGGEVVVSRSGDPLTVDGVALRSGRRSRVMLANMTDKPRRVEVRPLRFDVKLRRLNESSAEFAMREPEKFRAEAAEALPARDGGIELELMPYEIVTIEGRHD